LKPKSLLSQLSDLESSLNSFSFEELSSEEATRLQHTFRQFKSQLEQKVWGEEPSDAEDKGTAEDAYPANPNDSGTDLRRFALACQQLRTPLNGIIGLADMLNEGQLNEKQQYLVQSILTGGRELLNEVVELTEFSRLCAGLEPVEKVPFNFNNLVRDVAYLCTTLIVDKRLELSVDMDPAIPRQLTGDPSKVSQILLHLLGTVVKQTYDGHISLEVDFHHEEGNQFFLEFTVRSEGRSSSPLENKGTVSKGIVAAVGRIPIERSGLGLPIVQQIVKKLGGEMQVHKHSESSSEYAFRLPFEKGEEQRNPPGTASDTSPEGMRVLLLDSNPDTRAMTERQLRSWSCIPLLAESAVRGQQLLERPVDVLLIDLKNGEPAGLSLARRIRGHSNPLLRKIPVIALTDALEAPEWLRLQKAGVDDYIVRPYGAEELRSKLMKLRKSMHYGLHEWPSSLNADENRASHGIKIDLLPVLDDCMGKLETLEELLQLYKQKTLEFVGSVKLHLDRSDFKGIAFACQKVSSSLRLMGTNGLSELADQIYFTCRTNQDIRHLRFLHQYFMEEYLQVETALDRAMEALKNDQ